jgi:hypothetical protein
MTQQNRRNFLYTNGKVAPSLPNMGNVDDVKRSPQWVNPFEFYSANKFWEEPGRNFSKEAKAYYDKWLESLRGQKNVRPRTLTTEEWDKLVASLGVKS